MERSTGGGLCSQGPGEDTPSRPTIQPPHGSQHEKGQTWQPGRRRLPHGTRLHGDERVLWRDERRRVGGDAAARARPRRDLPRHGRRVRDRRQRGVDRAGRSSARRAEVFLATKFANVRTKANPGGLVGEREAGVRARGVRRVAQAARRRSDRSLLPAPRGPEHADRGDGRRDGRAGEGGEGEVPRPLRGERRDDPSRAQGASDHRAAVGVLALRARRGAARSSRRCASSGSASSRTARSAAAC